MKLVFILTDYGVTVEHGPAARKSILETRVLTSI